MEKSEGRFSLCRRGDATVRHMEVDGSRSGKVRGTVMNSSLGHLNALLEDCCSRNTHRGGFYSLVVSFFVGLFGSFLCSFLSDSSRDVYQSKQVFTEVLSILYYFGNLKKNTHHIF